MNRLALLMLLGGICCVAGCPVTQSQNTPIQHRMEIDPATSREYYIYVPSTYTRAKPAPLIITCHGTWPYDVAENHVREWKMLAEQNGCIVVAPKLDGTDGIFGDGPVAAMLQDERYIVGLISTLGYQYNLDMANVMITGFSGGGFPMYFVGFRHPDIFSCVVARNCNFNQPNLDGWFPPEASSENVMVYWGENDAGAIKDQSQNAIRFLENHGFRIETTIVPHAGHERHPEYAMDYFRRHWRAPRPSLPMETR